MDEPTEQNKQQPQRGWVAGVRIVITGMLMGAANLVPGVSGGTMVLAMGMYDRFIDTLAKLSTLRFSRDALVFLVLLVMGAGLVIAAGARVLSDLVVTQRTLMYCLFIGMTLAGAPLIWKLMTPVRVGGWIAVALGLALMIGIALTNDPQAKEAASAARESETFVPVVNVPVDSIAGAIAMSAMVLPGISGAYMLLVLGRYEHVTGAIALGVDIVRGKAPVDQIGIVMGILVPVGISAIVSLVLFSNLLKWLLARHQQVTAGALMGILLGSAITIWPFNAESTGTDYALGAGAFVAGLIAVLVIGLFTPAKPDSRA